MKGIQDLKLFVTEVKESVGRERLFYDAHEYFLCKYDLEKRGFVIK